jgi:hypothetical protein
MSVNYGFSGATVTAMRLVVLVAVVLSLAACGDGEEMSTGVSPDANSTTESPDVLASEEQRPGESTPDPKYLVVRLSDLPPGFSLVAGETIPTRLESVLGDPGSTGIAVAIRRERISGFQTSVWSPERGRFECGVALYRSRAGAKEIFALRRARLRGFVRVSLRGRLTPVESLGDEATVGRFTAGRFDVLAVSWRHRNVLVSCSTLDSGAADPKQLMTVVRAQQKRIATMLG